MSAPKQQLPLWIVLVVALVGMSVLVIQQSHVPPSASHSQRSPMPDALYAAVITDSVYLPAILRQQPPAVFGAEIQRGAVGETAARADDAQISWVRYNGIRWSEVEATQDTYDWSSLNDVEAELQALSEAGVSPIVIIRSTPSWARQIANAECGPIAEDKLNEFADFLHATVSRYSQAPYNVKYWELWNEPDVDPDLISAQSPFGCWGDADDPYYGGRYFAEMLKYAYSAIKEADSNAKVVLGGLLLDCDPTHTAPCTPGNFLEGVFLNQGHNYLDIVSYHGHPVWNANRVDWDLSYSKWKHRGGLVLGKLDFIREVMATYNVDKPVMMTEGGLLCHPSIECPESEFRDDQANYAVRLYIRAWANDLESAIWYTLNGPGWRKGGLLDDNQNPRPAYNTVQFLTGLLADAKYNKQLSSGALEGYAFADNSATYHIYWTNDGSTVSVSQPAGTTALYDKFGNSLALPAGDVSVGFEPIIMKIQ